VCVWCVCACVVCVRVCGVCVVCVCVCVVCVCVCVCTRFPGHSSWDDNKISTLQSPIELFRTKMSTDLK